MAGDTLARGGRSATFGPAKGISQAKWDAMWESELPAPAQVQEPSFKLDTPKKTKFNMDKK